MNVANPNKIPGKLTTNNGQSFCSLKRAYRTQIRQLTAATNG